MDASVGTGDRAAAGVARGEAARLAALTAGLFLGAMLFRSPSVLLAPRFWAEEGFAYFQYMEHVPLLDGLTFVYNGNYQLLTNVVCLLSAHVPDRFAAFPTALLGTSIDVYCAFLFAEALRERGVGPAVTAAGVVLFALQHAGYEVFLNTTNVMWSCSAGTLFIALGRERPALSGRALTDYASLACFGLTGITSVALAPVFLIQALRTPTRYRFALAAVLVLAATVQAGVVLHEGVDPDRAMKLTPRAIAPIVLETELAAFLPSEAVDGIGGRILPYDAASTGIAVQVVLVGAALLALFFGAPRTPAARADRLIVAGTLVGISAFNEFGGLGTAAAWHSGWEGGRYFFLGGTCFITLICLSTADAPPIRGRIAALALALALCDAAVQRFTARWPAVFTAGPSVASQVRACSGRQPCPIRYPPHGPGAVFMLEHDIRPGYELPPP